MTKEDTAHTVSCFYCHKPFDSSLACESEEEDGWLICPERFEDYKKHVIEQNDANLEELATDMANLAVEEWFHKPRYHDNKGWETAFAAAIAAFGHVCLFVLLSL